MEQNFNNPSFRDEVRGNLWRDYTQTESDGDKFDLELVSDEWMDIFEIHCKKTSKGVVLSFLEEALHYYDKKEPRWVATGWHPFVRKLINFVESQSQK